MKISRIQYISSGRTPEEHYQHIETALQRGIDWIQLRLKDFSVAEVQRVAQRVADLRRKYAFTLIVNDYTLVAKQVDADGVHLGLTDMSVDKARALLGPHKIIGGTANRLIDVQQRIEEGCDYIGLGPLRYTATKRELSPILGFAGYAAIMESVRTLSPPPLFAIGGVQSTDVVALRNMGIYGIALSRHIQDHFHDNNFIENLNTSLYGQ